MKTEKEWLKAMCMTFPGLLDGTEILPSDEFSVVDWIKDSIANNEVPRPLNLEVLLIERTKGETIGGETGETIACRPCGSQHIAYVEDIEDVRTVEGVNKYGNEWTIAVRTKTDDISEECDNTRLRCHQCGHEWLFADDIDVEFA